MSGRVRRARRRSHGSRPTLVAMVLLGVATGAAAQEAADGTLTPSGPPSSPPRRVDAGGACIVDLEQRYDVAGTLTGRLVADYRILVQGPCGTPPGTADEQWIAHGVFEGTVRGDTASATFWYTAHVRAGGAVEGELVLSGGIEAELKVAGRFSDGHLSYAGPLRSPATRSAAPRPGLQPVELNHVVLAVDQDTYDAIRSSDFLASTFATGGEQTVVADSGETWTGRYVVGERLYLEVFGPGGSEGRDPGFVGLAFSTTTQGDIDTIMDRLTRAVGGRAYRVLRHRRVAGEDRRWFHAVSVDPPSEDRRLGAWVMEFHPDHLTQLALPHDRAPTRAGYLRALRRALGRPMPPPERLLKDISRIDLVLTADERDDLATLLLAGGWTRRDAGPDVIVLSRPGLDLYVRTAPSPEPRLRSITFTLTGAPGRERELHFGHSTLTFEQGERTRWTFH